MGHKRFIRIQAPDQEVTLVMESIGIVWGLRVARFRRKLRRIARAQLEQQNVNFVCYFGCRSCGYEVCLGELIMGTEEFADARWLFTGTNVDTLVDCLETALLENVLESISALSMKATLRAVTEASAHTDIPNILGVEESSLPIQ